MFVSRNIHANHSDLIHDVAYDFYGLRMATCSSDQMVKVWDLRADGEWVCTARFRCHLGPAWRLAWAHPEFGQVIALCSFDRTITIWEEVPGAQSSNLAPMHDIDGQATATHPNAPSSTNWVRRAYLVDPRTSVTGLQFAPRHLGLQLAVISTDGMLRIYEALDVMNLSQWRLQFDFGTKLNGSCLSWSQSRLDPPLIAVGSGRSSTESTGTDRDPTDSTMNTGTHTSLNAAGGSSSSLVAGKLVLYEYSEARRHWDLVEDVRELQDAVYDVQFAPHMGQSFHLLAVGSKELYILKIRPSTGQSAVISKGVADSSLSTSASFSSGTAPARTAYNIDVLARSDQHKGRVWRVSWNVTGSVLASSGDDGYVRLWQANHLGYWQSIAAIAPGGSGSQPNAGLDVVPGSNLSQMPAPVRNLGNTVQLKGASHGDSELGKPPFERNMATPIAMFQKTGSFMTNSQPVAWH